jgi:hypothetical protein
MDNKDVDKPNKSNTIVYTISWNPVKSARLKRIRGVSFEELVIDGKIIDIIDNPGRRGQKMYVFEYKKYIWIAPCVIEDETVFLKTLYPSRKYRKSYKKGVRDAKV